MDHSVFFEMTPLTKLMITFRAGILYTFMNSFFMPVDITYCLVLLITFITWIFNSVMKCLTVLGKVAISSGYIITLITGKFSNIFHHTRFSLTI